MLPASYPNGKINIDKSLRTRFADIFIPYGRIFFSIMMIVFGYDHFLYTQFVATLVPDWIPWHVFWTYFAGVALMGSGICIMFKVPIKISWDVTGNNAFYLVCHPPYTKSHCRSLY